MTDEETMDMILKHAVPGLPKPFAWITDAGAECLQRGEGPVRAVADQDEDCGFTVALYRLPAH